MQCFCSKCCSVADFEKPHVYKLYSVITHVGATLTVGHYIAYTCSLDTYGDYHNCPKDKRKASTSSTPTQPPIATGNGIAASIPEKNNARIMKKMMFMRSKASSSGDMTKNSKNLIDGSIKQISNGMANPSSNSTCHGLDCCGIWMKTAPNGVFNGQANGLSGMDHSSKSNLYSTAVTTSNYSDKYGNYQHHNSNSSNSSSSSSKSGNASSTDPIWYMCDDDKIKAMSQREFEEMLSPNSKKITITPYLLFYARTDVQ